MDSDCFYSSANCQMPIFIVFITFITAIIVLCFGFPNHYECIPNEYEDVSAN